MFHSTECRAALGTISRCGNRSFACSISKGARFAHSGVSSMAITTTDAIPSRRKPRYLLDRVEVVGPLFIAPAILYVLVLVALPFFLAIYYSVSAFTIFDPSYRFVGISNFLDVIKSDTFRRTLTNTFVFTIGPRATALCLARFPPILWM